MILTETVRCNVVETVSRRRGSSAGAERPLLRLSKEKSTAPHSTLVSVNVVKSLCRVNCLDRQQKCDPFLDVEKSLFPLAVSSNQPTSPPSGLRSNQWVRLVAVFAIASHPDVPAIKDEHLLNILRSASPHHPSSPFLTTLACERTLQGCRVSTNTAKASTQRLIWETSRLTATGGVASQTQVHVSEQLSKHAGRQKQAWESEPTTSRALHTVGAQVSQLPTQRIPSEKTHMSICYLLWY